jgi:hypothetical protein
MREYQQKIDVDGEADRYIGSGSLVKMLLLKTHLHIYTCSRLEPTRRAMWSDTSAIGALREAGGGSGVCRSGNNI